MAISFAFKVIGTKKYIGGIEVIEKTKEQLLRDPTKDLFFRLDEEIQKESHGKDSLYTNVRIVYISKLSGGVVAYVNKKGEFKNPLEEAEKREGMDDWLSWEEFAVKHPEAPNEFAKTKLAAEKQEDMSVAQKEALKDLEAIGVQSEVKRQTRRQAKKDSSANNVKNKVKSTYVAKTAEQKEALKAKQAAFKALLERKKAQMRRQINSSTAALVKVTPQRTVTHAVKSMSADKMLSKSFASIPHGKAGSVSIFQPEKTRSFMLSVSATVPADVVVPNKKYKMPKIVQDSTIALYGKLKKEEMQKVVFFTWRGCLACATFFQNLVARTPMDEDYSYETDTVRSDRVKFYKNGKLKSQKELMKDANVRIGTGIRKHKADAEYVRGDWTITFRGKTFKAFESQPAKDSDHISVDYTFTEDLFEKLGDQSSIFKIADTMFELTKDSGDLSSVWSEFNINPRWQALEFGGWYTHQSKMAQGAKYSHRVDSTLLSYQAPRGFWRITRFEWNELVNTGKWKGSVESYINPRKKKIDVSKVESIAMKSLLEKYPELKNRKTTIGVYK